MAWRARNLTLVCLLWACGRPPVSASANPPEVAQPPPQIQPNSALAAAGPTVTPLVARGELRVMDAQDGASFQVELARTEPERSQGLMFRRSLEPLHGMLFFMPGEGDWQFWMRNTLIRLDMIFVDGDWRVVGVLEDVPALNEQSRGVGAKSRYVLELAAWEARRHHIVKGTRLEFRELPSSGMVGGTP